ncbi:MAG: presqualene diphosphate synthase HpnD [Bacteroidetes bacterium]|nr:presqualene diphosphate synthase HpnD [Bacteroidota bacterium]MBU1115504.1 presqualene diphosphate synthase HpnD [Bacteroidota bacterium]MBU1799556.1 presqualene diphosphate synthase HpnD [Bacteroidota bacterium]
MDAQAKEISKKSKSSFYYAFNLLPEHKREAMTTLYAFCRETDDIVDENDSSSEVKYEALRKWKTELEKSLLGESSLTLLNNLSKVIKQFKIPIEPFFDLIKGMEMDVQQSRYPTIDDLTKYCYRVAATVGLMSIEIFGYKNISTRKFAVNLGLALQLTNILRDIKKDASIGRIYLPQEDLKRFNYSEEELFANIYNDNFVCLMRFEANRAKDYFAKANKNLDIADKPSMFAARAMQHIYFNLLKKLEAKNFSVFAENINVGKVEKAIIAVGVWAKYSLVY